MRRECAHADTNCQRNCERDAQNPANGCLPGEHLSSLRCTLNFGSQRRDLRLQTSSDVLAEGLRLSLAGALRILVDPQLPFPLDACDQVAMVADQDLADVLSSWRSFVTCAPSARASVEAMRCALTTSPRWRSNSRNRSFIAPTTSATSVSRRARFCWFMPPLPFLFGVIC